MLFCSQRTKIPDLMLSVACMLVVMIRVYPYLFLLLVHKLFTYIPSSCRYATPLKVHDILDIYIYISTIIHNSNCCY